jgi:hypothetical protein
MAWFKKASKGRIVRWYPMRVVCIYAPPMAYETRTVPPSLCELAGKIEIFNIHADV